jgi:hypothetical protein
LKGIDILLNSEKNKKSKSNSQVDINESVNELKEDNFQINEKIIQDDEVNLKMRLNSMMDGLISSRPNPFNQNLNIPQHSKKKIQSNHIKKNDLGVPKLDNIHKFDKNPKDDQMEKIKMLRGLIKTSSEPENKEKSQLISMKRPRDPEDILKTLTEVSKSKIDAKVEKIKTIPLGKQNSHEENSSFYSSLKKVKNK